MVRDYTMVRSLKIHMLISQIRFVMKNFDGLLHYPSVAYTHDRDELGIMFLIFAFSDSLGLYVTYISRKNVWRTLAVGVPKVRLSDFKRSIISLWITMTTWFLIIYAYFLLLNIEIGEVSTKKIFSFITSKSHDFEDFSHFQTQRHLNNFLIFYKI